jgi:cytoplasmic iron level regulating protein YaaA (DUF328/UPF0246 family)
MMAYAESRRPKIIFILSAKYGLLSPSETIDPYEQTLKTMKAGERQRWAQRVASALHKRCDIKQDTFVLLAGRLYREDLVPHLRYYEIPMEGLAFGKQLRWLTKNT